jgi:hypothetical protein
MARHVTSDELAKLRSGALTPAEALRILEHRAACPQCRAMREAAGDTAVLEALLDADSCPARSENGEQRLVDFVSDRLEPAAAAQIDAHTQNCPDCAALLEELREEQAALRRPLPVRMAPTRARWWRMAAAVVALAVMAGASWLLRRDAPADTIHDGGALLALSRSGEWSGLPLTNAADRDLVLATLRSRRLPAPSSDLRAPDSGVLRGSAHSAGFELQSPVYVRVEATRPLLEWTALPNAASYRVVLFRTDLQVIETSPVLPGTRTQWQPTKDLPRGTRIGWQVTAERRGRDPALAPAPPLPPVYFEVLSAAAAERLANARAAIPPSHLLLASIYAREGMRAEARREVEALVRDNPESAEARALLADR